MTAVACSDDDRDALAAMAGLPAIGPARLRALSAAGRPAEVWAHIVDGGRPQLAASIDRELWHRWHDVARATDLAALADQHAAAGVGVIVRGDPTYPVALIDDHDAPAVLFHLGDPVAVSSPTVSIVGTRRSTGYGEGVAFELGEQLSSGGVSVVSGLALGIDGAAHAGAVSVEGAGPVAVVASGLDVIYPRRNRELWRAVQRRGCIWSESPLGAPPDKWRFPSRNRIIAALSPVLVVVESLRAGGSMHTVREADDRGRTVMAVPGSVRSAASTGPNLLLSEGCAPCRDVDDVTVALGLGPRAPAVTEPPPIELSSDARAVLAAFDWAPATVDELILRTSLDLATVVTGLAELVDAEVARSTGGWYERADRG